MRFFLLLILMCLTLCWSCQEKAVEQAYGNPHAEGFNVTESDDKAIAIADEVMEAMGGRQAWDTTRYFNWNFFGRRNLLWDKQEKRVRIDLLQDSVTIVVNMTDDSGTVWVKGEDISETDTAATFLERGESIWINDAYWLVMPFKLKDSGVTLKYVGQDTMRGGVDADVLQLTFQEVGNTPDNKYLVYVDLEDRLVKQWDYFSKADDPEPRLSTPWADYQQYGSILLSGGRGQRGLTDIKVMQDVPETVFTDPTMPDL